MEEFAGRELAGVGSREKVLVHSLPKLRKDTVLNVFIVKHGSSFQPLCPYQYHIHQASVMCYPIFGNDIHFN